MQVYVRVLDPLEPELQTVVSCHVGDGNETRVSGRAASALAEPSLQPHAFVLIPDVVHSS